MLGIKKIVLYQTLWLENLKNTFSIDRLKYCTQELDALACSLTKGISLNKEQAAQDCSDDENPMLFAEVSSVDSDPLDICQSMVFPGAVSDEDEDLPLSESKP